MYNFLADYCDKGDGVTLCPDLVCLSPMEGKNNSEAKDYISLQEYADKRGISLRTVHRWLKMNIIKGEQPAGLKGKWLIPK